MIRAVAIDDEVKMHRLLARMLKLIGAEVELVGTATSVDDGVAVIRDLAPDLLFLDVELGESGTGFDILKQIDAGEYIIIFISGYNKYAERAFRFAALDFINKPLKSTSLAEGLRRARLRFSQRETADRLKDLEEVIELLRKKEKPTRLTISVNEGIFFVLIEDILYLTKTGNLVTIHTVQGEKFHKAANMVEYEELFKPYPAFMLVHQSSLVNLKRVKALIDKCFLVMEDGHRIKIKDRGVKLVREALEAL